MQPSNERSIFFINNPLFDGRGPDEKFEKPIRELLIGKGARIVGEFRCTGQAGFLGFISTNKGHPDEQDLEDARAFARRLVTG